MVRHLHTEPLETPRVLEHTPGETQERLRPHHWQWINSSLFWWPLELARSTGGARARVPGGIFGAEVAPEDIAVEKATKLALRLHAPSNH
eukprot:1151456-Pelagomonas_calceolata.AAC.2